MASARNENDRPKATEEAGETELRGDALAGSEQNRAANHTASRKRRNPDAVLRLDGEKDSLYADGLEVDDDGKPPLGTPSGDEKAR